MDLTQDGPAGGVLELQIGGQDPGFGPEPGDVGIGRIDRDLVPVDEKEPFGGGHHQARATLEEGGGGALDRLTPAQNGPEMIQSLPGPGGIAEIEPVVLARS